MQNDIFFFKRVIMRCVVLASLEVLAAHGLGPLCCQDLGAFVERLGFW